MPSDQVHYPADSTGRPIHEGGASVSEPYSEGFDQGYPGALALPQKSPRASGPLRGTKLVPVPSGERRGGAGGGLNAPPPAFGGLAAAFDDGGYEQGQVRPGEHEDGQLPPDDGRMDMGAGEGSRRSAGGRSAGGRSMGPRSMGPRSMDPRSMDPRSMGPRSMGPRSMGPRSMAGRSGGGRSMGGTQSAWSGGGRSGRGGLDAPGMTGMRLDPPGSTGVRSGVAMMPVSAEGGDGRGSGKRAKNAAMGVGAGMAAKQGWAARENEELYGDDNQTYRPALSENEDADQLARSTTMARSEAIMGVQGGGGMRGRDGGYDDDVGDIGRDEAEAAYGARNVAPRRRRKKKKKPPKYKVKRFCPIGSFSCFEVRWLDED